MGFSGKYAGSVFILALSTSAVTADPGYPDLLSPKNIINIFGVHVETSGAQVFDATQSLHDAVTKANELTALGQPACIYIPTGTYLIRSRPPAFARAGCVAGDGPAETILKLDPQFSGNLFEWSEAWTPTTPGPTVKNLRIIGSRASKTQQNALIFYDRNDEVFIDNVVITDLPGRALFSGERKNAPQAYMRESHLRSLRFFRDGAASVPVVEFSSEGKAPTDATNEIKISQMDIYGSFGPSFVIRNKGDGWLRYLSVDGLRIEGKENGATAADLFDIGDDAFPGKIVSLTFSNVELIDPYRGYAALRVTAPLDGPSPAHLRLQGLVDGGLAFGHGLQLDAVEWSQFALTRLQTRATNLIIGSRVKHILLDGYGDESNWTTKIDPLARASIEMPERSHFVGRPVTSP